MTSVESTKKFCGGIAQIAAEVLSQITGREITFAESETPVEFSPAASFEIVCNWTDEFKTMVRCSQSLMAGIGEAMLGPGTVGEETAQAGEEFWRQVVGRFNTSEWKDVVGGEVELMKANDLAWTANVEFRIQLNGMEQNAEMSIGLSPQLSAHIASGVELVSGGHDASSFPPAGEDRCNHGNLALLLHVPLAVTLRFGERRLLLREILQLSSGAVIELDRMADDPVELCLDDRVIARGQVVVVDGCYGLRVSEICRSGAAMLSRGSTA